MLACFAGLFLYSFAVFAGFACKNSKTLPFVRVVGAKSVENGNALYAPLGEEGNVRYTRVTDSCPILYIIIYYQ